MTRTSIDHPDPGSYRERQSRLLAAAAHLAWLDLPGVAAWSVEHGDRVVVQLHAGGDTETALLQYAQVLVHATSPVRHDHDGHAHMQIEGDYRSAHFVVRGEVPVNGLVADAGRLCRGGQP